ncbi:MAG TPA: PqqD family protein [Planctomycetota bacterium]|nr:PqqD family protein [Planctomycetota bacterium]
MNKIAHLALNDEGFVFDPTTGDSFMVNDTGLFILKKLRDNTPLGAIAQGICDEYETCLDDAERDVTDFFGQLKSLSLHPC